MTGFEVNVPAGSLVGAGLRGDTGGKLADGPCIAIGESVSTCTGLSVSLNKRDGFAVMLGCCFEALGAGLNGCGTGI